MIHRRRGRTGTTVRGGGNEIAAFPDGCASYRDPHGNVRALRPRMHGETDFAKGFLREGEDRVVRLGKPRFPLAMCTGTVVERKLHRESTAPLLVCEIDAAWLAWADADSREPSAESSNGERKAFSPDPGREVIALPMP